MKKGYTVKKLLIIGSCVLLLGSCASNKEVQKKFDVRWAYEMSQDAEIKGNEEYIDYLEDRVDELEKRIEELEK